jgi:ATP-binding cassette, subfamily B, fatty acid transporter
MAALRSDIEDKVHRLPLAYFDGRQRGELLSRVTNDVDNLQTSLSITVSQLLTLVLTVLAVLAMMVSISPLLAVITLLTVPVSLLATRAIARRSWRSGPEPGGSTPISKRPTAGSPWSRRSATRPQRSSGSAN